MKPLWKQAVGSTIHCLAGDATGVIAAAAVTMVIGYPMWTDIIVEYVFGFLFGLMIFQALFMREMFGGSYLKAVRKSFMPEWLSMNAVMAGMIPPMVILMTRDMTAMEPTSLRFWGVMSLCTLIGFVTSYPVNMWLVAAKLKHGMGTENALGEGGHVPSVDPTVTGVGPEKPSGATDAGMKAGHDMSSMIGTAAASSEPHEMTIGATRAQIAAMTVLTILMLGLGVLVAALNGDISMGPGSQGKQAGHPMSM